MPSDVFIIKSQPNLQVTISAVVYIISIVIRLLHVLFKPDISIIIRVMLSSNGLRLFDFGGLK